MKFFELEEYFLQHLKPDSDNPANQLLGLEYENFVLQPTNSEVSKYQPLPMEGQPGVYQILSNIHDFGQQKGIQWTKHYEGKQLVSLSNDNKQSITIEPGGQIEFAGTPLASLHAIEDELTLYLEQLFHATEQCGSRVLPIGVMPLFPLHDIPLVDKQRYHIMFPHMKKVGTHGQLMMKATASTQVSVDYFSKEDLEHKFVFFNRLSPFLTAIFANSPLFDGKKTNFLSFRARIWQDTDPVRSGLPEAFLQEKFQLDDYIQWTLNASPYYLTRDDRIIPLTHISFKELMAGQNPEIEVTFDDWKQHLGMIFPDARIKNIIEMRVTDALLPSDSIAIPALLKALVYYEEVFEKVYSLLMDLPLNDFAIYRAAAAKEGLHAHVNHVSFAKISRQIFELALNSLGSENETWLIPYFDKYTKNGQTPADHILKDFDSKANGDIWKWADLYLAKSTLI
ncbi:MAG: glutamate--cysteine ligase [SAR324 cluster bacterium]|nr:glutamate--cysteine ligase [SAR324 cluster bacterium]